MYTALIGRRAGIVKADPATMVTLGNLRDPNTSLALFGVVLIAALQGRGQSLQGLKSRMFPAEKHPTSARPAATLEIASL